MARLGKAGAGELQKGRKGDPGGLREISEGGRCRVHRDSPRRGACAMRGVHVLVVRGLEARPPPSFRRGISAVPRVFPAVAAPPASPGAYCANHHPPPPAAASSSERIWRTRLRGLPNPFPAARSETKPFRWRFSFRQGSASRGKRGQKAPWLRTPPFSSGTSSGAPAACCAASSSAAASSAAASSAACSSTPVAPLDDSSSVASSASSAASASPPPPPLTPPALTSPRLPRHPPSPRAPHWLKTPPRLPPMLRHLYIPPIVLALTCAPTAHPPPLPPLAVPHTLRVLP
ncbi:hypothetical protein CLOP_g24724 [Closterium sp. NIES-67]|nr:hypothetical protein CLOP_g24724 [Closterium sp. NIES-67]